MQNKPLRDTVIGALGMALVFLATYFIKVPNGLQGYFNLGDGFILLFASFVNPLVAFLIGGVGSAFADLVGGYGMYVLPTLLTKGLEALVVCLIMKKLHKETMRIVPYAVGSILMLLGYFIADTIINESWLLGASAMIANLIQAAAGILIAYFAYPIMKRNLTLTQTRHLDN